MKDIGKYHSNKIMSGKGGSYDSRCQGNEENT